MSTPTKRSMDKWRAKGFIVAVVEKWVPNGPLGYKGPIITRDVWNFGDILAVRSSQVGAVLVQSTSGTNVSARIKKILETAEAGIWLAAGNRIFVDGWRKMGKKDERKLWECREIEILPGGKTSEDPKPEAPPF